jgi:hypothetical protein
MTRVGDTMIGSGSVNKVTGRGARMGGGEDEAVVMGTAEMIISSSPPSTIGV